MEKPGEGRTKAGLTGEVEQLLFELVTAMPADPGDGQTGLRGRPRILPSMCLWSGLLVCVLRGFSSQLALWRLLAGEGLWEYPRFFIGDAAIYKRLAEAGTEPLERLFSSVTRLLVERLKPWVATDLASFASDVVAIDATTLDPLARRMMDKQEGPVERVMPGKAHGLFDLRRQQWRRLLVRPDADENEKKVVRLLLDDLSKGTLVLADMGYFGFKWFDDLTEAGHWWISRLRAKTTYRPIHTFFQDGETLDRLVWLGANRSDRAKHAVRLVQFRQGGQLRSYLTNVCDPKLLSIHEIAVLYARRWDIEMAFQMVKEHLGLRLWWSSNLNIVSHQLWATFIIAQILMGLRLEIAGRANVDLFDVSLPLLTQYLPRYAARGDDPIEAFLRDGRRLGFIRPSRRIPIQAPLVDPTHIIALPPDLALQQTPRYAERRCSSRSKVI